MVVHGKIFVRFLFVLTLFLGITGARAWGASVMSENKVPGQVESKALV